MVAEYCSNFELAALHTAQTLRSSYRTRYKLHEIQIYRKSEKNNGCKSVKARRGEKKREDQKFVLFAVAYLKTSCSSKLMSGDTSQMLKCTRRPEEERYMISLEKRVAGVEEEDDSICILAWLIQVDLPIPLEPNTVHL